MHCAHVFCLIFPQQESVISPLTFLPVLADEYKPDPRDAAGARSEQLSDSDGWPAH